VSAVSERDLGCVACGNMRGPFNEHHRVKGRRSDRRTSNLILLCGSGSQGCHGRTEQAGATGPDSGPAWAKAHGYLVNSHFPPESTLDVLVWYQQPSLGRVGWYQLDDDGGLFGPVINERMKDHDHT
jgi:hypothetical protein